MEIKTKYNLGEEVWFIKNNKVSKTWIYEMNIAVNYKGVITACYNLNSIGDFYEHELFTSKEEVLKTL